jgi:hypothetical protein
MMRAYEFPSKVTPDGNLELPPELLDLIPAGQIVRVVVLVSEPAELEEQAATARHLAEQFLATYSSADAAYDAI